MKVLFDVNIFEDIFRANPGWPVCQELVDAVAARKIEGWILANTVHILHYFHRKRVGEKQARVDIKEMLKGFAVLPLRTAVIQGAWESPAPDFEDNMQIEAATKFGLNAIVTRNKGDFSAAPVPVYTPEELLSLIEPLSPSVIKVPFLDLKAQHHTIYNQIDDGITDVITSCRFVLGEHVERFEKTFAQFQDTKYCVVLNSGTSALHCALLALGIGKGDEVITVPHTFIATAEAISYVGARPVFVDIDEQSYTLCPSRLEEFIEEDCEFDNYLIHRATGRRIKAVIPVHLYGQPADMKSILQVAQKYNLLVIEDCAQAHGAEYRQVSRGAGVQRRKSAGGRTNNQLPITNNYGWVRVGGLGDIGCFSFYPGKNLGAYGEGGAVVTNNEKVAVKVRMIRDHGQPRKYYHDLIGYNYRMDAFQGVVLNAKLEHLKEWTKKRRENAALYNELLKDVDEVVTPKEMPYARHVYHLYVIRCKNRDQLQKFLQNRGIATGLHYPIPLHLQRAYTFLGYKKGDFPVTEQIAEEILSLPMFPELTERQIKYAAEAIKDFYGSK